MPKILYRVTLTQEERDELNSIASSGKRAAATVLNALILLNCDAGEHQDRRLSNQQICDVLRVNMRKIDRVKKRFVENGFEAALYKRTAQERPQSRKIDGQTEARLVTLACSKAPGGRVRWTLRLLADKLVELDLCPSVSHETVRQVLKKRTQALAKTAMGNRTGQKR